jgi:hypothetical protein
MASIERYVEVVRCRPGSAPQDPGCPPDRRRDRRRNCRRRESRPRRDRRLRPVPCRLARSDVVGNLGDLLLVEESRRGRYAGMSPKRAFVVAPTRMPYCSVWCEWHPATRPRSSCRPGGWDSPESQFRTSCRGRRAQLSPKAASPLAKANCKSGWVVARCPSSEASHRAGQAICERVRRGLPDRLEKSTSVPSIWR